MKTTLKSALLATAVAGLFISGSVMAEEHGEKSDGKVKCAGVNACKGRGQCGGADHACAGKNACKGKGWTKTTAKECADQKGTVVTE